jgi:putative transcriptional regulator
VLAATRPSGATTFGGAMSNAGDAMDAAIPDTTGRLLVATPSLVDPNFAETVILVVEHGEEGAFGLVVNRPSQARVAETVTPWGDAVTDPDVIFVGGPVEPDGVLGLGLLRPDADTTAWSHRVGRVALVDVSREPAEVRPDLARLRLFAGHSGWGPGQLDAEIAVGSWFVVDAAPDDPFTGSPEGLWRRVLARQGGIFSTVTADPSSN